jgi:hypothetical protein
VRPSELVVYLPDTRGVEVSRYGRGNAKLGPDVFTYSRLPGGSYTCPGSTAACEAICYAKSVTGPVRSVWEGNTGRDDVPPIPLECRLLRVHVSGDFDTVAYIRNWRARILERPDVTVWAYTRSWRVDGLLPALEGLRLLPNVQLFASMDEDSETPPDGWRRAWMADYGQHDSPSYVCPEQTGEKATCQACRYCFDGRRNDVTFLEH